MSNPDTNDPGPYLSRVLNVVDVLEDVEYSLAQVRSELRGERPPTEALQRLHVALLLLTDAQELVVGLARTSGETWEQIGSALSMSRQAAHERFGRTP